MIEEILIETEVYGDTIETESDSLIGTPGIDGATFIPSVSEDGVISWTNDKDLENPTPVNIKGEQGEQGAMGPQGPVGPQGEQGPKGEKGDQGIQGIQGIQGEPGADYVLTEADKKEIAGMIEVSGEVDDLSNYYTKTEVDDKIEQIELTPGPKGEQGIQGEPGAQGPKGDKGEKGEDAYIKITDNINKLDITTLDTGLYLFLGDSEYAAADLYYGEIYSGLILNRGTYLMIRKSDPYYTGYVFEPTNNIFLFSINSLMDEFKIEEYATKEELPTQISQLENDSGYVTNTDYASEDNVGLVKTELYYGLHTSSRNGSLYCEPFSYDEYANDKDDNCFVGKGTLENVLEAKDYASKGYVDEQISNIETNGGGSGTGGEVLPIGTMIPYSSEVIPNGFLPCDGSEVSRTDYKDLFAVIGTSYGAGDGETTFNLPDKRGRVSVGLDLDQEEFNNIGLKDGEKEVTLKVDEMPSHTHTYTRNKLFYGEADGQNAIGYGSNAGTAINAGTDATGGDKAHNNLQPYEVDQWIIKAFNGSYSQPVSGDVNDTLPVGSIIKFDGDYIPDGYEEVENPSIEFYTAGTSFTAKWDCYAEVFVTAYGWGYGASESALTISKAGNPEIILEQLGKTKGHDTVPDCVTSFGVYRLKKGNTYAFAPGGLTGGTDGGAGYIKLTPIN